MGMIYTMANEQWGSSHADGSKPSTWIADTNESRSCHESRIVFPHFCFTFIYLPEADRRRMLSLGSEVHYSRLTCRDGAASKHGRLGER